MDVLAYAAAHGADDFLNTGSVYFSEAHGYFTDQTGRLIDTGTLPYELGLFILNSSKISSVTVSGDAEHGFLTDGVTRPAGEAVGLGLTALNLWVAAGPIRGKIDVTADSVTGRVIEMSIRVRGLTIDFEEEPNGYSMLWAYASYLGLTAQDGFTGSIEGSKVTMRFGCGAVLTLEASFKQNMVYYHIRAYTETASVSGASRETETTPSPFPSETPQNP